MQDGALKVLQHGLQRFLGRDVQMVGRLVEQQEVRVFQRQQGQRQPSALTAAQQMDRLIDILAAEEILRPNSYAPGRSA